MRSIRNRRGHLVTLFTLGFLAAGFLPAAADNNSAIKILLPLGRSCYQTNEWIDLSVVRNSPQGLPGGRLELTLAGVDGGQVAVSFPVAAAAVQGNEARSTEHLHLNCRLLRPGHYTLSASMKGATAKLPIEVYSHLRQSSFRLINWGRATVKEQLFEGEDSLGYNLFYGHYGRDEGDNFIRAGVDYMANCVMSGGHQMDLRNECDWSDPYVTRGGTMRVVRRAMIDRTHPHVPGVHFYDEPGLTWDKNDATGEFGPHGIKSQVQSFIAAFGREPIPYQQVDPTKPEDVARWQHWARWKLGFMDAAWKESQFGVSRVRPDFLSVTQSQYGFSAYTDGYYFNVVRSLPVTSGHGGYHDYGPGFFNPSYHLEMARARDFTKPCWYLPTWYGNTTDDQYRVEQYLAFQTNVQGMMSPPDLEPAQNASARQGIVETNQLMKRLGPIFTTMPVTKPPVAMLYSLSEALHTQTLDRNINYLHAMPQGKNLPLTYLAGKLIQQQFVTVVEEDILDGTVANDQKAIILTSIDYLDPPVVAALEDFAAKGGLVLLTGDCTVKIKGATNLGVTPRMADQQTIDQLMAAKKYDQLGPYQTTGKYLQAAMPLAKAIAAELQKKGIVPPFACDVPTIVATRQAAGDIEYLFAVNGTHDDEDKKDIKTGVKSIGATITLAADGKPIYDAVHGGAMAEFQADKGGRSAHFRFGPGQMRVFARTARPIGRVHAAQPLVTRELSRDNAPITMDIGASLHDDQGAILSGSAPLHIRVVDSLGGTRFDLYRATHLGMFSMQLPLAANDPAGRWQVIVTDLLSNKEDVATFNYTPATRARSIAGATYRAVYAADDLDNVFRFARTFHDVTIVKGSSAFNESAAKRLIKSLEPWGIRCKEMPLAEASRPRKLTEEEARTWCGLNYAGKGQIKPGAGNAINLAGFAVQGPVILLGNAEDNPIIKYLVTEQFLAYPLLPGVLPGVGRGMVTWQRDGIGRGQESIALIAHDEAGMAEAVGTCYEAVAGLEPLTKWRLPDSDAITPAKKVLEPAKNFPIAWSALLPDRVEVLKVDGNKLVALTHDGTRATLEGDGKVAAMEVMARGKLNDLRKELIGPADAAHAFTKEARPDRLAKLSIANGPQTAVAYWGGTLRIVTEGNALAEQQMPQDITALSWWNDRLLVGLADGKVLALNTK